MMKNDCWSCTIILDAPMRFVTTGDYDVFTLNYVLEEEQLHGEKLTTSMIRGAIRSSQQQYFDDVPQYYSDNEYDEESDA
ncbi:7364_t:CDS:2 [Funneliformis mosseae]|uniref:7364_t:CDS:1 n=1 Tax=Funneliformis mosseae TaxID=27381 RepID=A0A9N9G7J7_FUNMO|nr:7364_t:CDS:2 [Funneliformis mosseae]